MSNSEQPASWRAFTKPPPSRQDFLKRITPLSGDLAAHGRTRTLALQKLHRICLGEVRTLKARYTLATVKLALSKSGGQRSPWTDPHRVARCANLK
jgi:hypothetical protein